MEKTLVNHTRPIVWNELFSRAKLAKKTLRNLLEKNDNKFTMLIIRPYFHRWNIIANFLRNKIVKLKHLVIRKGDVEQKKKILKKYLDGIEKQIFLNISEKQEEPMQKSKYF